MSARSASIVTRITVVFTVFVVLGTLAAGLLVYRGVRDELVDAARNDLRRTLDQGRTRLDGFAGTLADDIAFLSANDAMADLLAAQDSTDTLAIQAAMDRVSLLLESFIRSREHYGQVRLIGGGEAGLEVIRFDRAAGVVHRVDSSDLQAKGDRDYFLATMALGPGERYFSAIDLNKEQGRIEVPHRPTLRAAAPLFTPSGRRMGMVIINADLRPLFRDLGGFARGHQRLVLADAEGQVLLHPDTALMFRHELGGRFTLAEVTPGNGDAYITEQVSWGGDWLAGPHVLQVDVSRQELLAGLRRQRNLSLATTGGIAVLFALLSLIYARSIGRALDRLTARVERYAAGEGDAALPVERRDEIGRLSRSLARMQERIDARVKELEVARASAEASDRARREMLANMSHEVRTPLNAILGMSADLDTTALSEADQQKLGIVQRSAERLRGLVDDLLLHARIGEGRLRVEPAAVDVRTLIMDIAQAHLPVARAKGVALLTRLDDLPPTCLIDPLRLHQIVDNLVGNAVKFTPRGNVDIIASANEEELVVSVKDSGPGISEEDAVRIFQRFERAASREQEEAGAGLGLAITHRLTELLGGHIALESPPGAGTTFTVRLPLAVAAADPRSRPMDPGVVRGLHVLHVEDVATNRMLMEDRAAKLGWKLVQADGPEEAIALATERDFDLLLIDVDLGEAMRGTELAMRLRGLRRHRATPMVAVTANADPAHLQEVLRAGMNDRLTKPIAMDDLVACAAFWSGRDAGPCREVPDLGALFDQYDRDAARMPQVLQQYRREFANWHITLLEALETGDPEALGRVRHQLRPHWQLLGLGEGLELLDALEAEGPGVQAVQDVFRCCDRAFLSELRRLTAAPGA